MPFCVRVRSTHVVWVGVASEADYKILCRKNVEDTEKTKAKDLDDKGGPLSPPHFSLTSAAADDEHATTRITISQPTYWCVNAHTPLHMFVSAWC